jgi:hypothetical protein
MKKIEKIILLVGLAIPVLLADPSLCLSQQLPDTEIFRLVQLPRVEIIPPMTNAPAEIIAFSGYWEGYFEGEQPRVFVIEKIDSEKAVIVSAWGFSKYGKAGYNRYTGKIKGKKLNIADSHVKFFLQLDNDLKTLKGTAEFSGSRTTYGITLKKVQ